MAECAGIGFVPMSDGSQSPPLYFYTGTYPAGDCGMVVLAATEFAELDGLRGRVTALESDSGTANELPPTEDLAAAWGASFVLVVGCYAIGRAVGVVLNFLK